MNFPEIILPVVAGFLFASFHFFLKKSKDKILIQCIGRAITGVVLLFLSIFFENDNVTSSAIGILLIMVSVIIHSLASKVISIAYSYSNISLSLPIAKGCSIIIASCLSLSIYNEILGYQKVFGIIAVIIGIIFLNIQSYKNFTFSFKGVKYSIFTGMIIPLYLAFDKYAIQKLPVLLFCAMIHLGSAALLWQIEYNKDSRPSWTCIKNNALISISVIIHALGYTLILFAMKSLSPLTTLIASQTSLICATLLGILFLNEKINLRQIIAIISIIFGITIYSINNIK